MILATETSITGSIGMAATTPAASPSRDRQIALYEVRPDEPPSQAERIERAADGDLDARLDLMSTQEVEQALRKASRPDHPEERILAYLQSPGSGKTQADALKDVLDSLADKTEDIALLSAFVWRYGRAHQLWNTHRNPRMRTEAAFLNNLEQNSLIQINIVTGTSAYALRASCVRMIESRWGTDWFERVPQAIRPPVDRPTELSRSLLVLIAANSKSVSLDDAIDAWAKSVQQRTDVGLRRQKRSRLPFDKHIVSSDIKTLIQNKKEEEDGRRAVESYLPGLNEDRLELQPLRRPPAAAAPAPTAKRQRGSASLPRAKRVKVVPPVRTADDEDDGSETAAGDSGDGLPLSQAGISETECDGPAFQLILSKLTSIMAKWRETERCCDRCQPLATEALARIRGLQQTAVRLAEVTDHSFDGLPVSSLPMHGISPEKASSRRRTVTVEDSSDVD